MQQVPIEDLVGLPEDLATERARQGTNGERLRLFAIACSVLAFITILLALFNSDWRRMASPIAILALSRWVFMVRDAQWSRGRFRLSLVLILALYFGLGVMLAPTAELGLRAVGLLAPLVLTAFRVPLLDAAVLLVGVWLGTLGPEIWASYQASEPLFGVVALLQTGLTGVSLYLTTAASRREQDQFRVDFRREQSRSRERQRMREELASARQIQLSMLPRRDPQVDGLEISAASLPAAEVGGDYYEYFRLPDGRLALVIADVAGHGVASGLLLSGIRSCLFLLHSDETTPREIVEKLDRMVQQTTQRRMFITLVYAVIDLERRQLTFTTAGHPPPYRVRGGDVSYFEVGAPPLGTRLKRSYEEVAVPLEEDDLLVFYTDGLTEMTNADSEMYGERRLERKLRQAGNGAKSAAALREAVMSDAWTFKGNGEQLDDVTLIAIRVDHLPAPSSAARPAETAGVAPTDPG